MRVKKNAVDLTDLALGIVILGVVVAIGANVLVSMQSNRLTDLTVTTVGNETFAGSTETAATLSNTWAKDLSFVYNATGGELVPSTNYTYTVDSFGNGQIILTDAAYNATNLNATYTYYDTTSRADYTLSGQAATGLAEYGNWFDILVIVGVAAVILSLIFLAFGRRDMSGAGVSY